MSLPPIFTPEYYAYWRQFEQAHWWTAGMRDVATMLMGMADLPRDGVLLDVGCGSGQGLQWFRGIRPGWRLVGIDPGMDGLTSAVATGFPAVLAASATALPFASGSVDAVITLDVLQHLPLDGGDRAALGEMRRVLRPRGHLFIRTNAQAFPRVPDDRAAVWHKYEPDELADKLADAGFSIVRLSRINALLSLAEIPKEVRRARQRRRHSSYDVVNAPPRQQRRWAAALKRAWLVNEGRMVRAGLRLPMGRSIVALCQRI
jgi:SAM-dependent methyltransferase